jgi:hypothetical protein
MAVILQTSFAERKGSLVQNWQFPPFLAGPSQWHEVYLSPNPEDAVFPGDWNMKFEDLQRMIMVRPIPDCFGHASIYGGSLWLNTQAPFSFACPPPKKKGGGETEQPLGDVIFSLLRTAPQGPPPPGVSRPELGMTVKKIPAVVLLGILFPTKSLGTGYFFPLRTALKGREHKEMQMYKNLLLLNGIVNQEYISSLKSPLKFSW